MSDSEAKKAWARDNMMLVGLKLHRKYDADLVEYLTPLADKKQATIKAALREYIERHNTTTITTPAKGEKGQGEKE